MQAYLSPMVIPNPNLSKITIHRLKGDNGEEESLPVDLIKSILENADQHNDDALRRSDVRLQWGDRVEIPAVEGVDVAQWKELSPTTQAYLNRSLIRQIAVTLNGEPLPAHSLGNAQLLPEFRPYTAQTASYPIQFEQKDRVRTGTFTTLSLLSQLHVSLDTMVRFTVRQAGKAYDYDVKTLKTLNPWLDIDAQANIQQLSP